MILIPLQAAVLNVLRRAHPRPMSTAAIVWNLDREGGRTDTRTVTRALDALRGNGLVRREWYGGKDPTYGLVTDTCQVCGGSVGTGGVCGRCGEAG